MTREEVYANLRRLVEELNNNGVPDTLAICGILNGVVATMITGDDIELLLYLRSYSEEKVRQLKEAPPELTN